MTSQRTFNELPWTSPWNVLDVVSVVTIRRLGNQTLRAENFRFQKDNQFPQTEHTVSQKATLSTLTERVARKVSFLPELSSQFEIIVFTIHSTIYSCLQSLSIVHVLGLASGGQIVSQIITRLCNGKRPKTLQVPVITALTWPVASTGAQSVSIELYKPARLGPFTYNEHI